MKGDGVGYQLHTDRICFLSILHHICVDCESRRQPTELEIMHRRYMQAPPPQEGERQSLAYRLGLLIPTI
jgi:hypothetical protein